MAKRLISGAIAIIPFISLCVGALSLSDKAGALIYALMGFAIFVSVLLGCLVGLVRTHRRELKQADMYKDVYNI